MLLDFPAVRQSTDFSCGAAALQGILAYFGVDTDERELSQHLSTNSKLGTEEENIVNFARKLGFKVTITSMFIKNVVDSIKKKIPVILLLQAWSKEPVNYFNSTQDGHFVVAIGYGKNGLFFQDPFLFQRGYLDFDELNKRWHSKNGTKFLGIVIHGKPIQFDSSIAEHID